MTVPDGGPAFPTVSQVDLISSTPTGPESKKTIALHSSGGMSLRDYFAAAALQGLCARGAWDEVANGYRAAANHAYQFADAMLTQREGPA